MSGDRSRSRRRLVSLPGNAERLRREIDDEIRFHIESRAAELVARGMTPEAATARAIAEYGDLSASREELRRVARRRITRDRVGQVRDALYSDVVYGVRTLRKKPGFTLGVVLVLALGIGANATMFGVIDRLLLRPPAQVGAPADVARIAYVRTIDHDSTVEQYLSYPIYLDARATPGVFEAVAAYSPASVAVGVGADAQSLRGMKVSANFFSLLRVHPAAGRFFLPEEDGPGAPNVVVLSYGYWQRAYDGDPAVVGRALSVGQTAFTVVGVAPRGFTGATREKVDVWIPITAGVTPTEYAGWSESRNGYWMLAIARVRRGVTRDRAAAATTVVLRAGERRDGKSESRIAKQQPRIALLSILPREALANDSDAKVAVLLGAVSLLVLIIACANVANLQLVRALDRRREIAVRIALGVSRSRLIGQLLTESMLLAIAGGLGALGVTYLGSALVRRVMFVSLEWQGSVADPRVLAYTALAALLAGTVSGMVPALRARSFELAPSLKEGAREGHAHRRPARLALLIVQTMLCVVLLVGTGLFVQSLRRVQALPIGMEPGRALIVDVPTAGTNYTTAESRTIYERLERDAAALPGVESAALSTALPFSSSWSTRVHIPGRDTLPTVKDGGPYFNAVSADYFKTMGMHVLRGRGITAADGANTHRVVVVNETIARLWWAGDDAIGKCMKIGGDTMPCSEVVGIVVNPRRQALIEDLSLQFFLPIDQAPAWVSSRVLSIRPHDNPETAAEPLRRQLQLAEPGLGYIRVWPLSELVDSELRSWRLGATMFAAFGSLALFLAAIGLYSLLAYDVGQRTHEIGVRVALGARVADVSRTVLRSGVALVAVGAASGLALALLGGRFIEPLLFRTSAHEPAVIGGVIGLLAVVAMLAMLVPTWRAARVDPIVALRAE
jgi:predicted permease